MKVYVVTQGEYSAYHIEAVFVEKEKAELYVKLHETDRWSPMYIEEYETGDETIEDDAKNIKYIYYFDLDKNGNIQGAPYCSVFNADDKGDMIWALDDRLGLNYTRDYPETERLLGVTAKILLNEIDTEKAKRVLYDLLAEYKYLCIENDLIPPWESIENPYNFSVSATTATF